MSVEKKAEELCRQVLGGAYVVYIDLEAALDAVMQRIASGEFEPPEEASDTLEEVRSEIEEAGDALSSARSTLSRIESLMREGKALPKKSAA